MSDRGWITNHTRDPYVIKAQKDGYRSRASYKLIEIDDKYRLFRAGSVVLDLGAAPGGWSQVALQRSGDSGLIVAVDLLEMDAIAGVVDLKVDFTEPKALSDIGHALDGRPLDVVMSDMAVNTTGIKNIDSIQTGELCKEAMVFSKDVISEKGFFISKIFMGSTFNEIVALGKKIFKEVKVFKPKSSRKDSKESFIICKNLR